MRRRLRAATAILAALAVILTASPAMADTLPLPPPATDGRYGSCNMNAYTAASGQFVFDFACQSAFQPAASRPQGIRIAYQTTGGGAAAVDCFWGLTTAGDPVIGTVFTNQFSDMHAVLDEEVVGATVDGWAPVRFRGSCLDPRTTKANGYPVPALIAGGGSWGDQTAGPALWLTTSTTYGAGSCNNTAASFCGPDGGSELLTQQTWTTGENFSDVAWPTTYFAGGQAPVINDQQCSFTTDAPTDPGTILPAGTTVHVTFTYSGPVATSSVAASLWQVPTLITVNPPAGTWITFAATTSPQTVALTVPALTDGAGAWAVSARCELADGSRITSGTGGVSGDCFPAPCDSTNARPSLADCMPSSSGGLFGIVKTVLDPETYVKATVCFMQVLFEPGPATMRAVYGLWTNVKTRAPFSFLYDAVTFLPGVISSFASGLSSGGGTCLFTVSTYGCATVASTSDLSLVRNVLLAVFVFMVALGVIRTTMRVVG